MIKDLRNSYRSALYSTNGSVLFHKPSWSRKIVISLVKYKQRMAVT